MIEYIELQDGSLLDGGDTVPRSGANARYIEVMKNVANGVATISPWAGSQREADYKVAFFTNSVQAFMNAEAGKYGYNDMFTAVGYATSTDSKFGPEGVAFRDWRDNVWNICYSLLDDWRNGGIEPTVEEVISSLPTFSV